MYWNKTYTSSINILHVVSFIFVALLFHSPAVGQFQLSSNETVKVSARYHLQSGTMQGFLIVKLEIPDGSYIYSTTQKAPLKPSRLTVKPSKQYSTGKQFRSDKQPTVIENDPDFQCRLEKHSGTVQFYVPIKLASNTTPKMIMPEITFSGQVCSQRGYCVPIKGTSTKAKFAGFFERQAKNSVPPLKQKK